MHARNRVRLVLEALEDRQLPDANPLLMPIHAAALSASISTQVTAADKVIRWNNLALQAIATERTAPPLAARNLAMVSIAMFDAVNGILRQSAGYSTRIFAPKGANVDAALATAAFQVLIKVFPNEAAGFRQELRSVLVSIPLSKSRILGQIWGSMAANSIIRQRQFDGAGALVTYTPSGQIGRWEPTPPAFVQNPLLPQWPGVTPFALSSADQFRAPPPPSLTSAEYTQDWEQVKELGAVGSVTRTADQTEIARFWAQGAGTYTPPGIWNLFAQQQARDSHLGLYATTRLFAALNVAMADAGIACWDAKYFYDYWRPVTAIRKADLDGNPDTTADPDWSSLLGTPPFPTYTSGHSTFSAAAAEVLSAFFGANKPFSGISDGLPGVTRSWSSFRDSAQEASNSRVYGGIHFMFDCQQGLIAGRQIGIVALQRFGLSPAPQS
jgi:hypothetical protein